MTVGAAQTESATHDHAHDKRGRLEVSCIFRCTIWASDRQVKTPTFEGPESTFENNENAAVLSVPCGETDVSDSR